MADQVQSLRQLNQQLGTLTKRVGDLAKVQQIDLKLNLGNSYKSLEEFTSKVRETAQLLRELGKETSTKEAAKAAVEEYKKLRDITKEIVDNIKQSATETSNLAKAAIAAQNKVQGVAASAGAVATGVQGAKASAGAQQNIIQQNQALAGSTDIVTQALRSQQREYERGIHAAKNWVDFVRIVRSTQLNLAQSTSTTTTGFRDFFRVAAQARASGLTPEKSIFSQLSQVVNGLTGNITNLIYWQARWYATKAIIFGTVGAFKDGVNTFIEFDQQLQNIKSITNATNEELKTLSTTIITTAKNTKFGLAEIGKATSVLAQAGFTLQQINASLPTAALLATAALTDLDTTVKLITSSVAAFGLEVNEISSVADVFANAVNNSKLTIEGIGTSFNYVGPIAAQLGLNMQETAAAMGILANKGVQASTIGTSLRTLFGALVAPTDKFRKALQRVGLTVSDVNPRIHDFETILNTLKNANLDVEEIFAGLDRRAAGALTSLLQEGGAGFAALRDSMTESGSAAKKAAVQLAGFQQTIEVLKQNIQIFFTTIVEKSLFGERLLGFFDNLKERLSTVNAAFAQGLLPGLDDTLAKLGSWVQTGAIALGALFASKFTFSMLSGLVGFFRGQMIKTIAPALGAALGGGPVVWGVVAAATVLAGIFGTIFAKKAVNSINTTSKNEARRYLKEGQEDQARQSRILRINTELGIIKKQLVDRTISEGDASKRIHQLLVDNEEVLKKTKITSADIASVKFGNYDKLVAKTDEFSGKLKEASEILNKDILDAITNEKLARLTTTIEEALQRRAAIEQLNKPASTNVPAAFDLPKINKELADLARQGENFRNSIQTGAQTLLSILTSSKFEGGLANLQSRLGDLFDEDNFKIKIKLLDDKGVDLKKDTILTADDFVDLSTADQARQKIRDILGDIKGSVQFELSYDATGITALSGTDTQRINELVETYKGLISSELTTKIIQIPFLDQVELVGDEHKLESQIITTIDRYKHTLLSIIQNSKIPDELKPQVIKSITESLELSPGEIRPEVFDKFKTETVDKLSSSLIESMADAKEKLQAGLKSLALEFERVLPTLKVPDAVTSAIAFENSVNSLIASNNKTLAEWQERVKILTEKARKNPTGEIAKATAAELAEANSAVAKLAEATERYQRLRDQIKGNLGTFAVYAQAFNSAAETISKSSQTANEEALKTADSVIYITTRLEQLAKDTSKPVSEVQRLVKDLIKNNGAAVSTLPTEIFQRLQSFAEGTTDSVEDLSDAFNFLANTAVSAKAKLIDFGDETHVLDKLNENFKSFVGTTEDGALSLTKFSDVWKVANNRLKRELEQLKFNDRLTQAIQQYTAAVSTGIATTQSFHQAVTDITKQTYDVTFQLRINERTINDTTRRVEELDKIIQLREQEIRNKVEERTGLEVRAAEFLSDVELQAYRRRLDEAAKYEIEQDKELEKIKKQRSELEGKLETAEDTSGQLRQQLVQLDEQEKLIRKQKAAFEAGNTELERRVGFYQASIIYEERNLALLAQEISQRQELANVIANSSSFESAVPVRALGQEDFAPGTLSQDTVERLNQIKLKLEEISRTTPKINLNSWLTTDTYNQIIEISSRMKEIGLEQQQNLIKQELNSKRLVDLEETRTKLEWERLGLKGKVETGEASEEDKARLVQLERDLELNQARANSLNEQNDAIREQNKLLSKEYAFRQNLLDILKEQDKFGKALLKGIDQYIQSIQSMGQTIANLVSSTITSFQDTMVQLATDNIYAVEEFNQNLKATRDQQRSEQQTAYAQDVQDLQMKLLLQETDQRRYQEALVALNQQNAEKQYQIDQEYQNKKKDLWEESKSVFQDFLKESVKQLMKAAAQMIVQWLLVAAARALAGMGGNIGSDNVSEFNRAFDIAPPPTAAKGGLIEAPKYAMGGQVINNTYYQTVKRFAEGGALDVTSGGKLSGGIPNKDSILAWTMPGEYVVRKSAVENYGADFFHRLNSERIDPRKLPRFASGGEVGGSSSGGSNASSSNKEEMRTTQVVIYNVVDPNSIPQQPTADDIVNIISLDTQKNGKTIRTIRERLRG